MGIFRQFPYSNFHELNMDWLLSKVDEWGKEVERLDKKFKDLQSMFHSLLDYVNSFFDSLVIQQAVDAKLESMLQNGELDAILGQHVMRWDDLRFETFNGRPVMRWRESRNTTTPEIDPVTGNESGNTVTATKSIQNGTVYSPDDDYSMKAAVKYIYFWATTSEDTSTKLCCYRVYSNDIDHASPNIADNDMSYETGVCSHARHGGTLCIKDGVIYSITEKKKKQDDGVWVVVDRYLYRFGITNPAQPVPFDEDGELLSENITCANLIAWLPYMNEDGTESEHGVWLAVTDKANGTDGQNDVYEISEDFQTQVKKFTLDAPIDIVTQDFSYDKERKLIYQTTSYPNEVIVYSAIDGHVITSVAFPKHMSYVNCGEMEWAHVKGNMLYCGSMHVVGVSGDLYNEYNAWGCDLNNLQSVRTIQNTVSGRRVFYIDGLNRPEHWTTDGNGYPVNDGGIGKLCKFNVPFASIGGWNHHFAFVEDAYNAIRELEGGEISFTNVCDYSFHIPYDSEIRLGSGNITHPFKVDKDVVCNFRGFDQLDFSDSEYYGTQSLSRDSSITVKYNVCFDVGSHVTMPSMSTSSNHFTPSSLVDYGLVCDRCTMVTTATSFIEHVLLANTVLLGTGHIIRDVDITGGLINCRWFDIYYSGTQDVDTLAIIRAAIVCGQSSDDTSPYERPTLTMLKNHNIPLQCMGFIYTGQLSSLFPIFTAASYGGHTDCTWYYTADTKYRYRVEHNRRDNPCAAGFYGHYYNIRYVPSADLPSGTTSLITSGNANPPDGNVDSTVANNTICLYPFSKK